MATRRTLCSPGAEPSQPQNHGPGRDAAGPLLVCPFGASSHIEGAGSVSRLRPTTDRRHTGAASPARRQPHVHLPRTRTARHAAHRRDPQSARAASSAPDSPSDRTSCSRSAVGGPAGGGPSRSRSPITEVGGTSSRRSARSTGSTTSAPPARPSSSGAVSANRSRLSNRPGRLPRRSSATRLRRTWRRGPSGPSSAGTSTLDRTRPWLCSPSRQADIRCSSCAREPPSSAATSSGAPRASGRSGLGVDAAGLARIGEELDRRDPATHDGERDDHRRLTRRTDDDGVLLRTVGCAAEVLYH